MLNSYDAIKEAFVKHGHVFSGRPQDLFFITDITEGLGNLRPRVFQIFLKILFFCGVIEAPAFASGDNCPVFQDMLDLPTTRPASAGYLLMHGQ